MIQPALINLLLNEYSQELHYCSFVIKLDRCVRSFYTLNDLCMCYDLKYVFQTKQKI